MAEIAVLGGNEFVLGFQLAGIRNVYVVEDKPYSKIKEVMGNKEVGVVIVDEKMLDKLDPHDRNNVEDSINPVFVPLSTEATQDNLKKLIRKSIGVDLWKD